MKKSVQLLLIILIIISACTRRDNGMEPVNNGDKKIGYLFYTGFTDNFNASLYQTFSDFKAAGVTDLIIDLRYNHGGSLDAAAFLASLIAPRSVVESRALFTQLDFNALLNAEAGNSFKFPLGQPSGRTDPLEANLNLNTVYIIATDDSYSASELLTFCLRPYMKVVHVGSNTGGKFTASFTVTAYDSYSNQAITVYDPNDLSNGAKDSLKDWAMQPIVAIYKDANGADFSAAGTLTPDVPVASKENDPMVFKPIGDQTDYLLAATIARITGTPASATSSPRSVVSAQPAKLFMGRDELRKESVLWKPAQAQSSGTTAASGINTVSQFVYDGLSVYYRWNTSMISKVPTEADQDPVQYFSSVLYPLDTQHGWSWITNDANALFADFSGTPVDFGWGLGFLWANEARTQLVAIVKYVFPGTPAANAGIKRGQVITKISGSNITANPSDVGYYYKLVGMDRVDITVVEANGSGGRNLSVTPVTISANPVLLDTIYTIPKQ